MTFSTRYFILTLLLACALFAVGYFLAPPLINSLGLEGEVLVGLGMLIACIITAFVLPRAPAEAVTEENDDVAVRTLYVGNLPYRANEQVVRNLFSDYGKVYSVRLMKDKHTGKRRGFGFVEMADTDAAAAMAALNDTEFQQRTLKVREAKEKKEHNQDNN